MKYFVCATAALLIIVPVFASDVYVVQGNARGPAIDRDTLAMWTTDAFFYNPLEGDARVTLVSVSNNADAVHYPLIGDSFTISPHRSVSFSGSNRGWGGFTADPLWVLHLDVTPGVLVDDVMFIGWQKLFGSPSTFPFRYGKLRLPVFRTLTPAGQPQFHLATSLGPASNNPVEIQVSSRINVAIYNPAAVPANAAIEIRQHCDDRVVTSRQVTIPGNTIVQFGGFDARTEDCPPIGSSGDPERLVYTVVTVDQPSFSFVSNLSNSVIPTTSISITANP